MNICTYIYIYIRAKKLKKQIPKDFKQILKDTNNILELNGNKIIFSFFESRFAHKLNASASIPFCLIFSMEWAARYVLFRDNETENAFLITVGHELTHKDNEFKPKGNKRDKNFIKRVNEVHADFGAVQKMVHSSRKKLLSGIEYKKGLCKADIEDAAHPSWAKRKYYAENFNFDQKLVKQIAKDMNYENQYIIEKISVYYKEIMLR